MSRKIAFDWGGTLASNAQLVYLAKSLLNNGWCVYCISAVPEDWDNKQRASRIWEIKQCIPNLTDVIIVNHDLEGTHQTAYEAGIKKAEVMERLNIPTLVDDNADVIKAVRFRGLVGLQV